MIYINHRASEDVNTLTITGHAGYDDHGNDVVCAGVSAITYTLLGFLTNHLDDIESTDAQLEGGHVHIKCRGGGETAALAFEMAVIGIEQIAVKYPKHVTVDIDPALGG